MKKEYVTTKFYPNYPIFVISYYNENKEEQMVTLSSSYTLGDMLMIAISKASFSADKLILEKAFTVNFINDQSLKIAEVGGYYTAKEITNKALLSKANFCCSRKVEAPYILECDLILECVVDKVIDDEGYKHIKAKIVGRLIDEKLLNDKNQYIHGSLKTILYEGDHHKRVYRHLSIKTDVTGNFVES